MASAFLGNVSGEIERARDELYGTHGSTEKVLAEYLDAALHEIKVTKYLETLQGYQEGLESGQQMQQHYHMMNEVNQMD